MSLLDEIESAGVRTLVVVDAENLFGYSPRRTPNLVRALDDWTRKRVELPLLCRTYGHPRAIAHNWHRTSAVMAELDVVHVPNTYGKDNADHHLEADVGAVRGVRLDLVMGSGDQKSLKRCFTRLAGGQARIGWVVFNRASPEFPPNPFGRGKVLDGFPRRRTAHIDKIYQDWVVSQERSRPIGSGQSQQARKTASPLLAPESVNWAEIRPETDDLFGEKWRRCAVDKLPESTVLETTEARQIISTLQTWLPQAIPEHYLTDLDQLSDEAWTYHCLSAIFARAMTVDAAASEVEARMLRYHLAEPTELSQRAYERTVFLVEQHGPS